VISARLSMRRPAIPCALCRLTHASVVGVSNRSSFSRKPDFRFPDGQPPVVSVHDEHERTIQTRHWKRIPATCRAISREGPETLRRPLVAFRLLLTLTRRPAGFRSATTWLPFHQPFRSPSVALVDLQYMQPERADPRGRLGSGAPYQSPRFVAHHVLSPSRGRVILLSGLSFLCIFPSPFRIFLYPSNLSPRPLLSVLLSL